MGLKRLRAAILAGTYEIPAERVAEAILANPKAVEDIIPTDPGQEPREPSFPSPPRSSEPS
jgi:hypothetical protein